MPSERPSGKGELLPLGRIARTRGNKGEVVVETGSEEKDHYLALRRAFLCDEGGVKSVLIERVWIHKGSLVLKLKGVDTIPEAERLRGKEVWIEEADLPALPGDQFYIFQIIGLEVRDKEGNFLGRIEDVIETAGADIWVVRGDREILIPAVKEFILEVKPEEGRVVVELPEGLVEI